MKRKFTFLIAAAFMLLTMMASTGTMWGQSTYTKVTTAQSDWTGTYVIVADASNVIFTGQSGSNNYGGYAAVTISNSSVTGDFSNYEVEIEKSGDYYTMKHSSSTKYLGWTSGNYLYFSTSTPTANSYKWSLSTNAILNASDTNRKLQYNSGSPRFACYTSSQKVAYLYKKETGGDAPTITADPVSIGYNETSGSITYTIDPSTGASITNAVVTTSNPAGWLTVSSPFTSPIALTCEANATPSAKTAIVTLTCTYGSNQTTTKTVSVTQEGNPNASGGANNPYSVAEAFAAIDAGTGITGVYATGIVSQVDSYNNNYHSITYWISDNGTTTDQLEAYGGISGIDGWTFNSVEDIAVGATVVIHGNLKKFNTTYEFDLNNELVSYTAPAVVIATPTFSPEAGTYTEVQTVTISCETTGVSIYYTTDGSNPDKTSTLYNGAITVSETKTIKAIAYDSNNNHSPVASSTYTINLPYIGDPYARVDNVSYLTNGVRVIFAARFDENAVQYYAMSNTASGKPTGVPFTSTTSNTFEVLPGSILNSENSYYWTVGVTTDGYTFTNANGDVLGWTSSTNFTIGGDNTLWTVESGTSGESAMVPNHTAFNIVNVGSTGTNTTRGIALNNQYNFGPYAMSNNNSPDYNLSIDIFVQGAEPVATPSITAANVDIEYSVTNGNITYTINNEPNPAGTLTAAVKEGTTPTIANFSLSTVTDEAVPFTCDANDTGVIRTATVTLTYTYGNDQTVTKDVVVTQTAAPVIYTTIPQIFAAATSTETNVNVTFGNWVVSGVTSDGKTAYVTDNDGNGFIIFTNNNDFVVNDKLSGTVNGTPLKLYNGAAEFTNLTATTEGLTVGHDGEITILTNKTIADLSGVNTGAVITLSNLTFDGTNLSDGTNTIKPYNTLFDGTFENGKTYNVTGVYLQFNTTKEILPRSADDIEEVTVTTPSITLDSYEVSVDATEHQGTWNVTYNNIETDLGASIYWYTDNTGSTTTDEPDWIDAEINATTLNVDYVIDANTGDVRIAYLKVCGMDSEANLVYSDIVTINQAAGSTPPTPGQYDWVLTDLEDLTADDVFVIVGNNGETYAMSNNNGTGSAPSAVEVSVTNGTLSGTIEETIQWNLSISDDGYTFYPNGTTITWLYCTNTNNGVRVGNNTNKTFTVSDEGYLKHIGTSRYVGIYNSQDWRCYTSTSTNINDQTFAFYKRVPATPSISINPGPFDVNSNGGNAKFPIEYANLAVYPQLSMVFVAADGVTPHTYDWISADIVNDSICGHILINEGNARTAYFKVAGYTANNDTICSNIAIVNQSAYTLSIVFQQPASIDLAAGGETDRKISFDYQGLGNNPTFEVHRYESDGTTPATYDWLTTTISGNKVKITVPANPGDARHAYFKVYGTNGTVSTESNLVTVNQAAHVETYSLVTNVDQIVSGKHYLIASSATDGDAYAMGGQNSNNRSGVVVTIENCQIAETTNVYEFVINTHETSSKDVEYYTIYDAVTPGYLYAAGSGSGKNYLRTKTTLDNNGKWTITIATEGSAASVVAQGSNTNNNMKFNSNNSIFSCYASGQSDIYLYVKDNDDNLEYYGTEITYPGTSIPDGGSITVGSGSVITVPNGFTNDSPDNILIEEGGQLIHTDDVAATVQKNITAYTAKDGDGWYLIATPVETIDKSVVAGTTYDLFLYSEPDAMWYAHWDNPGFQTLNRGQGYLYANAEDKTINYAGSMKATNANINIDLDYTNTLSDAVRGFNLVGNPFTRNLVLGDMKLGGANLTTYYVTNTDRTALQAITSDAYQIKPGEGFFVQATAASQQLSFNASSKDDIDFRYIKIVAGNENGYDNAYIQMGDCNTLRKMNIANKTEVYVMDGEDDYAAARVEELAGSMPVHFKAIADGEYTITIEAKYTDVYYMHLFDNFTGEDIDLMLEPSYTFHAAAEDAENRFLLVFDFNNHLSVNENYINDVFAYQYGDEIIINGEGELQIFDVMGRMVLNTKVNGVQSFNVPSNGVYILRIIGNDIKTQKIVVK